MSPPLRKEEDIEILWEAIAKGHIQVIATDHCPFSFEKDKIPNAHADITIINPNKKSLITQSNMHGACDYTIYEGKELLCSIDTVISRGKIIFKDDKFLGSKGNGKFIKRKTLNYYADNLNKFKLGSFIDIDCN